MSARTSDSFQASPHQQHAWSAEPGGPTARIQAVLAIEGEVDEDAIADALRRAVARHEILRTTFVAEPGLMFPLQVVHRVLEPEIRTLDLSAEGPGETNERLE